RLALEDSPGRGKPRRTRGASRFGARYNASRLAPSCLRQVRMERAPRDAGLPHTSADQRGRALARGRHRPRDRDHRPVHSAVRRVADGYRERADTPRRRVAHAAADDRDLWHFSPRGQCRDVRARRLDAARIRRRRFLLCPVRLADRVPRERARVVVRRAEGALRGVDRQETRSVTRPGRKRRGAAAPAVAALAVLAASASADEGEPFRTRNLSPLVSVFGIPAWSNAPVDGTRVAFTAELANHYRFSQRGDEMLILDGET